MKCISDEGECGLGGYCDKRPWKLIADLEQRLQVRGERMEWMLDYIYGDKGKSIVEIEGWFDSNGTVKDA